MRWRTASRRGSVSLLMVLVVIPVALLGLALAGEYSLVLVVRRQAAATAEAAAMAAATAVDPDDPFVLDRTEATRRASSFVDHATAVRMLPPQGGRSASVSAVEVVGPAVEVEVRYPIPRLFISEFLSYGSADGSNLTGRVRRGSRICIPGAPESPNGCSYPQVAG